MKSKFSLKHQLACTSVAFAIVLGGCATTTPKTGNYVVPPIGSTWVTARTDSGSYGSSSSQVTTKRGEQTWQGLHVTTLETAPINSLFNDKGGIVAFANGDKPIFSFDPAPGFAYPLEVGKTLTSDHQITIYPSMKVVPMQVVQKVEALEDVTVPAGTFKAFRIKWSESIGNENVYWINPETGITVKSSLTRTAKFSAGPGTRESQLVSQNISN